LERTTELSYDPAGNITSVLSPAGSETRYDYYRDNLLRTVRDGAGQALFSFTYNPTHTLSGVTGQGGKSWSYEYDEANRLTEETDHNNSAHAQGFSLVRGYDPVSNLTSLAVGSLSPLTYSYNDRNELSTLVGPGGSTSFAYDPAGNRTEIETPDASERTYSYDPANRVSEVSNQTASGTQEFTYTYDASGNVLSENDKTYGYDELNRLVSWYEPSGETTTTYAYDARGNLTEVAEDGAVTEAYTYDAASQITNSGFTYDDNGNLTSDGQKAYEYDSQNRLIEVRQGQTTLATITYDFLDRRTSLTSGGSTTYFHYAGTNVVAETDSAGMITASYAYDDFGQLISMTRGGQTYIYQFNGHGDVVSLSDMEGQLVNQYTYDPWGKILSANEQVSNPYRYACYRYDSATGLYHLWHRYYSPVIKRFLSRDQLGGVPQSSQSLNRYAYVLGSPTRLVDPSGMYAAESLLNPEPLLDPDFAVQYWESKYQESGDPWWLIPKSLAWLATPDVAPYTFAILGVGTGGCPRGGGRLRLAPNPAAEGAHTTFRPDPATGRIGPYATWEPQPNPRNPNPWNLVKRFDPMGKPHYNKADDGWVYPPHVHEPGVPGGVRPAEPWEVPNGW
jgi:RHS repeat-associated protein